ncbi:energy transducer TonB [Kosakonia sp. BYX6]|uniref:Energy transducer TonB n=1 Tax=Kosakonia calanthes TaxID=3139408 RepID=A0ABZ3BFG5_9ENTR
MNAPLSALRRLGKYLIAIALAAAVGWQLWQWLSAPAGVQRKAPEVTTIIPLPPPPPPPPKPEPPPEPETPPPEQTMVEPTPVEKPAPEEPKPAEEPKAADNNAQPMQMNSDAQAGSDAFNIGAGSGGGMAGSGGAGRIGNATYGQYLGYALQKLVRENDSTGYLAYQLDVDIWIDREGRVTRAEIRRSSGDADVDEKVATVLRNAVLTQRPTTTTTMPVKVRLNSRRPT